jgi:hypothetical protein
VLFTILRVDFRFLDFLALVVLVVDDPLDAVVVGVDEALPTPAPPLVPPPPAVVELALLLAAEDEPVAAAGAVPIRPVARRMPATTAGTRSNCVAREIPGYDKHNPFSFRCLRG